MAQERALNAPEVTTSDSEPAPPPPPPSVAPSARASVRTGGAADRIVKVWCEACDGKGGRIRSAPTLSERDRGVTKGDGAIEFVACEVCSGRGWVAERDASSNTPPDPSTLTDYRCPSCCEVRPSWWPSPTAPCPNCGNTEPPSGTCWPDLTLRPPPS